MPPSRFPSPWSIEDIGAAFVVKDGGGQQPAYVPQVAGAAGIAYPVERVSGL